MFNFKMPTRLIFGAGTLGELNKWVNSGKKALVVVSNGKSTKVNGYLDRTTAQLEKAGAEWVLFDEIEPNPLKATVERGAACARRQHVRTDGRKDRGVRGGVNAGTAAHDNGI